MKLGTSIAKSRIISGYSLVQGLKVRRVEIHHITVKPCLILDTLALLFLAVLILLILSKSVLWSYILYQ
jgi:hypothetical protein